MSFRWPMQLCRKSRRGRKSTGLHFEWLEGRVVPASPWIPIGAGVQVIATGADAGVGQQVKVFAADSDQLLDAFFPYDPEFNGGVRVAVGDVDNDTVADIVCAPGPGGGPNVLVVNGKDGTELYNFFAYDQEFSGGVNVALGDVNNDGFADVITGAGTGGGPHVATFSGKDGSLLASFFVFDQGFTGGVSVGAGDVNGDGFSEIIAGAGPGGGPSVVVFSGRNNDELANFFAYDARFTGGVYVAGGDVNGDGSSEVITGAGAGGGSNVSVFDVSHPSASRTLSFFAYDPAFTGGVRIAALARTSSGQTSIITAPGPGGGADIGTFGGVDGSRLDQFFAYDSQFSGGVFAAGTAVAGTASAVLDGSFGTAGVVLLPTPAVAGVVQPDGKIAMLTGDGTTLQRFNPDGSASGDPHILIPPGAQIVYFANKLTVQPDGKLVLIGGHRHRTGSGRFVSRFNSDDSLDRTFNLPGGRAPFTPQALALTADGKTLVAGMLQEFEFDPDFRRTDYFAVVRLNSDLTLDSAFGSGGTVRTPIPVFLDRGFSALTIQADGKILAAGEVHTYDGSQQQFQHSSVVIFRYNPDGSLDSSFNGTEVVTPLGTAGSVAGLDLQPDGKIVVAYNLLESNPQRVVASVLTRYLPNWSLDSSFGTSGQVKLNTANGEGGFTALVIRRNGSIITAGVGTTTAQSGPISPFDSAPIVPVAFQEIDDFGINGQSVVRRPIDLHDAVGHTEIGEGGLSGVLLQPDGKLVLYGYRRDLGWLARFNL